MVLSIPCGALGQNGSFIHQFFGSDYTGDFTHQSFGSDYEGFFTHQSFGSDYEGNFTHQSFGKEAPAKPAIRSLPATYSLPDFSLILPEIREKQEVFRCISTF